jgi:hypothetical protein
MPALNPRVSVTLTPELAAVLRELSVLCGNSQSALIAGLLEQSAPVLTRMVTVLQAAATIQHEASAEIARGLRDAHTAVEKQFALSLDGIDDGVRPILAAAEKVRRRAGRGEGGGASAPRPAQTGRPLTPMSNRGVTPTNRVQRKASK